jgi:NTP pyrophosphatase (non-canonical NTP hydrolase)
MKIDKLKRKSNEIAHEKGFWEDYDRIMKNLENDKDKKVFHLSFINQKLMLIVSELGECMESLRKDRKCEATNEIINELIEQSEIGDKKNLFFMRFNHFIKDTFEDELADVFIRLSDLCGELNVDIEKHIELKTAYNKLRESKHNKNF